MKHVLTLLICTALFSTAGFSQGKSSKKKKQAESEIGMVNDSAVAIMKVNKELHDYGTIEQNADPFCEFTVTNLGKAPLIISNAKGSCGCTVPTVKKDPILPGDSTVIQVRYDTKRIGPFTKTVTLTSNAHNTPVQVLKITGKVEAPPSDNTEPVRQVKSIMEQ